MFGSLSSFPRKIWDGLKGLSPQSLFQREVGGNPPPTGEDFGQVIDEVIATQTGILDVHQLVCEIDNKVNELELKEGQPGKDGESIKGDKGDKGDPGESIKGDKGDKGEPGESIKGDKGDPGESIKGDPGESIKGDKGDPGESIKGDKGDPGKDSSANIIERWEQWREDKLYPAGSLVECYGNTYYTDRETKNEPPTSPNYLYSKNNPPTPWVLKHKGSVGGGGSSTPGKDGYTPIKGKDYFDGVNGKDGAGIVPLSAIADSPIKCGQPIYIKANTHADLAQANIKDTLTIGLAYTDSDVNVEYLTEGAIDLANWTDVTGTVTLTVGDYFLSSTVVGRLTTVVPNTGFVIRVGHAIGPTTFIIKIETPIKL